VCYSIVDLVFFATIWFTYDKVSYVKIRAYDSKNKIRMIRTLELWFALRARSFSARLQLLRLSIQDMSLQWRAVDAICQVTVRCWMAKMAASHSIKIGLKGCLHVRCAARCCAVLENTKAFYQRSAATRGAAYVWTALRPIFTLCNCLGSAA